MNTVPNLPVTAVVAVLALCAARPAGAQIAPGRSGTSSMHYYGGEVALRELALFGRCFARQEKPQALALIATEPGSREEADTYKKIFRQQNQSCLGTITQLSADLPQVRGAIAEGLYLASVPLPPDMVRAAPTPGTEIRTFSEAARCYAAVHQNEVKALVTETMPGSKAEDAAVIAMLPEFTKCVPEKARKLQFDVTQIRFRLAEALLRLPNSPPAKGN